MPSWEALQGMTTNGEAPQGTPQLKRVISRWQIVGLAMNDVIGSGVYLLPAAAAAILGAASLGAVLLAGLAVLLLVLCFVEASSYFDRPGSAYLYARTAFGDLAGFQVGWMTWLARIAAIASLTAGFAQALSYFWPAVESGLPRMTAIVFPIVLLTAINVVGVRSGVYAAMFLIVSKMLPLLMFVAGGLMLVHRLEPVSVPEGTGNFGEAALLLLFAYAGFENTPAAAGEYRNPKKDVPFALIVHIILVTSIYVAVQWICLRALPDLAKSATPLADAGKLLMGSWAGWILTVGGALSIIGTAGNTVLAGPRYLYALSRDGFLPEFISKVHPRFRTPARAVVLQSVIALPLALTGRFAELAALSVVARLVTYIGTAASVPILRKKFGSEPGAVRLPGGPLIPMGAVLLSLALFAGAQISNLIAALVAAAVGMIFYLSRKKPMEKPE
jgi:APA family basic amino acid/polyamine antiporter